MPNELDILVKLSVCLVAALIGGFATQRMKLSPIVGYLLAGIAVGPQTPGFVADQANAAQFAELGIILLMFGVGLHFNLHDLLSVRRVALPGALVQMFLAALLGTAMAVLAGWGWVAGIMVGISVSVASTVVLTRVLADNNVIQTEQGHMAIGWLIVQDIFTVLVLVILPAAASARKTQEGGATTILAAISLAILKIVVLVISVLWGGTKAIPRLLEQVARTRTRELFTLTVLALALSMATAAAWLFGVSMALGAFLAGMVVGQSEVSHQAAADALPMRDAFAVLFFVSVGMLFDPVNTWNNLALFVGLLGVILVASPIIAFVVVWLLGYSVRAALTIAVGIAQIGEFSFILANLASEHELLPREGQSLLVACSIVAIALNPVLFRWIAPFEAWLRRQGALWKFLSRRAESRLRQIPAASLPAEAETSGRSRAIIVGYGPVGQTACAILKQFDVTPVVIDLNIDTVMRLTEAGELSVYGDATRRDILEAAGISAAQYLLVTTPDPHARTVIVIVAKELNPSLKVFVRAHYLGERAWLQEIGATEVCFEEAEAATGLAALLLREMGADENRMQQELRRTRSRLALHGADENR
ncbi:MAG TPA: cation:proton antiporter [Pirellulales bacterium]|nr:cation:proton antiporter [Pirellulales bacterium]